MREGESGVAALPVVEAALGMTDDQRRGGLRRALGSGRCLRFLEAHSPLSALLAERTRVRDGNGIVEYDGFWSSSLTDSTERGKPDIELIDIPGRMSNINEIFDVTSKPLIMDGDTGGQPAHFAMHVRALERLGVSAVIIEDKTGLKKNSLFGNEVDQRQESVEAFCHKLESGKAAQRSDDFMIIARVESLILERGMNDALDRASAYVEAGADGIMIHSRRQGPDEVLEFAERFGAGGRDVPLVCVPTSYNAITHEELQSGGFDIVIYANHLLRASYLAMRSVAEGILLHGRSKEVEAQCLAIQDVLELIPGTR